MCHLTISIKLSDTNKFLINEIFCQCEVGYFFKKATENLLMRISHYPYYPTQSNRIIFVLAVLYFLILAQLLSLWYSYKVDINSNIRYIGSVN